MNKRHYEHTLPNIRGSLSNTYEHSSTATLFEHNFSAAFPIFNRPYFADAQYRNYKILPKFLACFSLKGNL